MVCRVFVFLSQARMTGAAIRADPKATAEDTNPDLTQSVN